jgi:hypothetical protein
MINPWLFRHMTNLSAGVFTVGWIIQYIWMTLMHSGWSTARKSLYLICHRRLLPLNHLFRSDKQSFLKGKTVRKGSPKWKFGADIMKMFNDLKELENGVFEGYGENHNWTHKSCLWELSYVKVLILPHKINLMHHEQNIAESIMSSCLDVISFIKDNMNVRKELAALCDRSIRQT